jgi:phosphoribosyl 1,2-cyclic phosphodiesterase
MRFFYSMGLHFKTLRSGSSGNSALIWTARSAILIDFAPGPQRECREILSEIREFAPPVEAVVVTHAHGDHISRNAMRVLAEENIPIVCHHKVSRQIVRQHGNIHQTEIREFLGETVIGDFTVNAIEVEHAPRFTTTALTVRRSVRGSEHKISIFTDLCSYGNEHIAAALNSDLIFLEANHDMKLLEENRHPGSEWHLPNRASARFLHDVCHGSSRQPSAVVLGHLSETCNRPELPMREVHDFFAKMRSPIDFSLCCAGRFEPGETITLAR